MVAAIFYFLLVLGAAIVYVLWQLWELQQFRCTHYEIKTKKLSAQHRWVVLSDVHLWQYGTQNVRLVSAIKKEAPEAIFLPGDLIVHTKPERFFLAEELLEQLVKIAPVYLSNGNHESRLENPEHAGYEMYQRLKARMQTLGVHLLNNQSMALDTKDCIQVHGLELPLTYYQKGVETPMQPEELQHCLGRAEAGVYHILLAHTPKYIPEYFAWGADLTFSGHYHGGLVCVPGIGSIVSPQFEFLPKYSFGRFDKDEKTALISRGLGTHTFHIRIFNRAELLVVTAKPSE